MDKLIRKTQSVCPVCLKRLPAGVVRRGDECFIEKTCPEHGFYSAIVWRGDEPSYEQWGVGYSPPGEDESDKPDCTANCGLCEKHLQKTCCALVEVTRRCDLSCHVCFAESGTGIKPEPSLDELRDTFCRLAEAGNTFVQLSGGEPAMRENLPEIIAIAHKFGCETVQLNTNGVRLAEDTDYAKALRDAGLSFVFMQFDGTRDGIYEKLRGKPLLDIKKKAIENCAAALLGVTLVPTLVPGVNCDNIGEIIDFAVDSSPAVRGVHFQPVSYFGRYPHIPRDSDRITLPEVLRAIEAQTGGKFKLKDFAPSRCDHPYCGFHGDFVVLPKNAVMKLTPKNRNTPSCCDDAHLKNREFVARRWTRTAETGRDSGDMRDMDTFLNRIKSHGFTITAMAFQDAYNLDIDRLRRCSLHVADAALDVPFCARYLTPAGE